jgi:hypothetical protein
MCDHDHTTEAPISGHQPARKQARSGTNISPDVAHTIFVYGQYRVLCRRRMATQPSSSEFKAYPTTNMQLLHEIDVVSKASGSLAVLPPFRNITQPAPGITLTGCGPTLCRPRWRWQLLKGTGPKTGGRPPPTEAMSLGCPKRGSR